jgi:hypothetical protein
MYPGDHFETGRGLNIGEGRTIDRIIHMGLTMKEQEEQRESDF